MFMLKTFGYDPNAPPPVLVPPTVIDDKDNNASSKPSSLPAFFRLVPLAEDLSTSLNNTISTLVLGSHLNRIIKLVDMTIS